MTAFLGELERILVPKHQLVDGELIAELMQQLAQSDSAATDTPMSLFMTILPKNHRVAHGQQIDGVVEFGVLTSWQFGKRMSVLLIPRKLRVPKHLAPWQRLGRPGAKIAPS